jgi:hypothetical protein
MRKVLRGGRFGQSARNAWTSIVILALTNSIKESLRLADPLRESPSPASAETGRNKSRIRGSNASTSNPGCSPDAPRRPKAGHRRLHRVRRISDYTGCRRHV